MRFIYHVSMVIVFSMFSINAHAQNSLFKLSLLDLNNEPYSFKGLEKYKTIAFVFLLSDCPASQDYTLTLNNLYLKYKNNNITFIGIFPGKFSTDDELNYFGKQYKIKFSLLKDPDMVLAKMLGAKIVPTSFLIDNKGNTLYKGRINDWLFALGKKRMQITQNNLEDALKSIVKNQPIKIRETDPIGCILEY